MAKKKNTKIQPKKKTPEIKGLPQNIMPVGEHVEENKNIYILQSVYKEIHKFTANKTVNEAGGLLVGSVLEEFGKTNVMIEGFVEAKHCEATPTTLKFTHETWEQCHKEIDKRFPKKKVLGWIHTHPDYGIFLSEYDRFIQDNFFSEENEIAYVVDPIQHEEGFYFWINGKLERCKGFYLYDAVGKTIDVKPEQKKEEKSGAESATGVSKKLVSALLVLIAVLFLIIGYLGAKVISLQRDIEEVKLSCQINGANVDSLNGRNSTIQASEPQEQPSELPSQVIPMDPYLENGEGMTIVEEDSVTQEETATAAEES